MRRLQAALLFMAVAVTPGAGAEPADAAGLQQNFDNTRRLLEESSAAKRVEASGKTDAAGLRERARDLYRQATAARDAGDTEAAAKLLSDAKKEMFNAVRVAGSGAVGIAKQKDDFDTRATSVQTLLNAHKIVFEEDAARNAAESSVTAEVEALVAEAQKHYDAGDYTTGKGVLDQAYGKLKVSIEHMRGGETLVNKIEFKTKADEYQYYRTKVDSQLEAIRTASSNLAGTPKGKAAKEFLDKMSAGKTEAEALAGKGDYDGALAILIPLFSQAPYQLMSLLQ